MNFPVRASDFGLGTSTQAQAELDAFLASPRNVGIDGLKESLRNIVQIMQELQGYNTGQDLQHLARGEHSGIAMHGSLKDDEAKRKKQQFLKELMEEFDRIMAMNFNAVLHVVREKIDDLKDLIDEEIEALDQQIEEMADNDLQAAALKNSSTKRKKLLRFRRHVEVHENIVENSKSTAELIDVADHLEKDAKKFFNEGVVPDVEAAERARMGPIAYAREMVSDVTEGLYEAGAAASAGVAAGLNSVGGSSDTDESDGSGESGRGDESKPDENDYGF